LKNAVFWGVMPYGSCKKRRFGDRIASFIRVTRIGELGTTLAPNHPAKKYYSILYIVYICIASIILVIRIGELGTTLAVSSNRSTLLRLLLTANVVSSSPILVTLMMEAIRSPKRRFLQEPDGVTSQKTAFFNVTAVETSNLTFV
jgi:hypothetical protein